MIVIGPAIVGLAVWLAIWLLLGHFWIGVIAGVIVACCGGGITLRGPRRF